MVHLRLSCLGDQKRFCSSAQMSCEALKMKLAVNLDLVKHSLNDEIIPKELTCIFQEEFNDKEIILEL